MTAGLRASPSLVIDTNLLLLLLGCWRLESRTPPERVRVLRGIRGRDDDLPPERFEDLWELFRRAERRLTTQYVIVEVYRLRQRLRPLERRKDSAWSSFIAFLMEFGVEEQSCSILELNAHEFRRALSELGPTDAGLLQTAQQQEATLLTEDEALRGWARHLLIPALSLYEIGLW